MSVILNLFQNLQFLSFPCVYASKLPDGVIGNTLASGARVSWFESRSGSSPILPLISANLSNGFLYKNEAFLPFKEKFEQISFQKRCFSSVLELLYMCFALFANAMTFPSVMLNFSSFES